MRTLNLLVLVAAMATPAWPFTLIAARGSAARPVELSVSSAEEDFPLDKNGTTRWSKNRGGPQVLEFWALASRGSFSAERTGFAPASSGLQDRCLSQSSHVGICQHSTSARSRTSLGGFGGRCRSQADARIKAPGRCRPGADRINSPAPRSSRRR